MNCDTRTALQRCALHTHQPHNSGLQVGIQHSTAQHVPEHVSTPPAYMQDKACRAGVCHTETLAVCPTESHAATQHSPTRLPTLEVRSAISIAAECTAESATEHSLLAVALAPRPPQWDAPLVNQHTRMMLPRSSSSSSNKKLPAAMRPHSQKRCPQRHAQKNAVSSPAPTLHYLLPAPCFTTQWQTLQECRPLQRASSHLQT